MCFCMLFSTYYFQRYHNGWLTLQRRQVQPRPQPQQQRAQERNGNENPAEDQENAENGEQEQQHTLHGPDSNNPNTFRLAVSFVLTFFTSLVPERPRIAN